MAATALTAETVPALQAYLAEVELDEKVRLVAVSYTHLTLPTKA